jgi:hypothetical protein
MGFSKDLGQIRNALAAAVLLFGLKPLVERNLFKYVLVVLVAFGVQAFAVIALPVYWLYPIVKNRKYLPYIILSFSLIVSFFNGIAGKLMHMITVLPGSMEKKVLAYYSWVEPPYYNVFNISFLFFGFVFLKYRNFFLSQNKLLMGLVVYHFFSLCIYFLLFDFPVISGRMFDLLSFNSVIILLSVFVRLFHGISRVVYLFTVYLYAVLLFYSVSASMSDYNNIF